MRDNLRRRLHRRRHRCRHLGGLYARHRYQLAAALTASFNLLAGFVFIWRFWPKIRRPKLLLTGHFIVTGILLVLAIHGPR